FSTTSFPSLRLSINVLFCNDLLWEEEKYTDDSKWRFLEHKGPVFPPPYEPLPDRIRFYYDGKAMKLSPALEEVATFYEKMLDHEYTTKDIFRKNFFKDWRKEMTSEEKSKITELKKCDFTEMHEYFKAQSEARKQMSKEEKQISVSLHCQLNLREHTHAETVSAIIQSINLSCFYRKSKKRTSAFCRSTDTV
uniref:DNA topoisomerase I DNA binding eukaryotic-type domain-containing protein n=1 Tax=Cyprinus carpio TaxID=7962 RepID=A0A8C2DNF0_CYPCA